MQVTILEKLKHLIKHAEKNPVIPICKVSCERMLINFIDDSINTRYDEVTCSYLAYQLFQHLTPALLGVNLYKLARSTLIVALDPLRSSG